MPVKEEAGRGRNLVWEISQVAEIEFVETNCNIYSHGGACPHNIYSSYEIADGAASDGIVAIKRIAIPTFLLTEPQY